MAPLLRTEQARELNFGAIKADINWQMYALKTVLIKEMNTSLPSIV